MKTPVFFRIKCLILISFIMFGCSAPFGQFSILEFTSQSKTLTVLDSGMAPSLNQSVNITWQPLNINESEVDTYSVCLSEDGTSCDTTNWENAGKNLNYTFQAILEPNKTYYALVKYKHAQTLLDSEAYVGSGFQTPNIAVQDFSFRDKHLIDLRMAHSSTLLNDGRLLIVGGMYFDGGYNFNVRSAEVFNPSTQTFSSVTSPFNEYSAGHTATLLNDGKVMVFYENHTEVYDPVNNNWQIKSSSSDTRSGHEVVKFSDGKVFVFGGDYSMTASTELYDPILDIWTVKTSMATASRVNMATAFDSVTDDVYAIGGEDMLSGFATDILEKYSYVSDAWVALSSMSVPRTGHTATWLLNDKILVIGGHDYGSSTTYSSIEIYDPISDTWQSGAPMSQPRSNHQAVLLNDGRVVVYGGGTDGGDPALYRESVEIYDPATDTWSSQIHLNEKKGAWFTANLLADGKIVYIGGLNKDNMSSGSVVIFDSVTETGGVTQASLRPGAYSWFGYMSSLIMPNGQILYLENDMGGLIGRVYNPALNTWTSLTTVLPYNLQHARFTALNDGRIVLSGGLDTGFLPTNGVQIFDPVADSWITKAPMNYPRSSHQAILLKDNRILVIGGYSGGTWITTNTAEVYDPILNTWTMIAPSPLLGVAYKSVLMADGKVFVYDNSAVSYIYDPIANSWFTTSARNHNGVSAEILMLKSGHILFISNTNATSVVESYNPVANTWTSHSPLSGARMSYSLTLLKDGRVLITGGINAAGNPVKTIEIFDPVADLWTVSSTQLKDYLYGHTAMVLQNGKVMVVGGYSQFWEVLTP